MHVHSRYSRACSQNIDLQSMAYTAAQKGISILGTGDFTHPLWLREIKNNLKEREEGLYAYRDGSQNTRFVLSVEVSNVFDVGGKTRKIHNCILVDSIEVVEQANDVLSKFGDLSVDGRPTLKMSAAELVEIMHGISENAFVFPAHAWTPFYGVLGSISGFDSIEDAYGDQAARIHALETGLSSDPPMNWRLSKLDRYALVSNSDAHSLPNLGREANVFEIEREKLSYSEIISAIKSKDKKRFKMTIEFYPEEGKYHFDGHRNCNVSLSPEESLKYNNICPVCGKRLVIGVMHRVEDLADRPAGYIPKDAVPYVHAVPLKEAIAYVLKKSKFSAAVDKIYEELIKKFGSEFGVILNAPIESIAKVDSGLATAIENMRTGHVNLIPGYDGVFGIVDIMNRIKKPRRGMQNTLPDF
ncbi:MAG: endonuclease Q family protein, partial [Candidatus Micrarchaeaceae archaeon]